MFPLHEDLTPDPARTEPSVWIRRLYILGESNVEATSVTPFSPRALDRGLAGTFIALARHGHAPMTPPRGATEILKEMPQLQFAVEQLAIQLVSI